MRSKKMNKSKQGQINFVKKMLKYSFSKLRKYDFNLLRRSLLRFNTAPLGAVHAGGAGDLFPRNSTALKDKFSIPRGLR